MELRSFESIMAALGEHGLRFLLVGGMAVVAHGHGRLTHDLDDVRHGIDGVSIPVPGRARRGGILAVRSRVAQYPAAIPSFRDSEAPRYTPVSGSRITAW